MSDAGSAATAIVDAYNTKVSKVAPGAVAIQLGLTAALGLFALSAFSVLRPNNSVVYQPKVKYAEDEKRPPKIGRGLFDWVAPVFGTDEQDLMAMIGLDSVTYLRFLRMCRNSASLAHPLTDTIRATLILRPTVFICIAGLTCAILIPVDVVYNLKYVDSDDRNNFLMLTMSKVRGNWLWYVRDHVDSFEHGAHTSFRGDRAHVVGTYVLTLIAFYFIWRNYDVRLRLPARVSRLVAHHRRLEQAIVKLRWQWFRSPAYQDMLYARSLMVSRARIRLSETYSNRQSRFADHSSQQEVPNRRRSRRPSCRA